MTGPIPFTSSDAWLLLAVAVAAGDRDAPLVSVIAVGDGINHAIFTPQELRRGTAKLLAGAFIRYQSGRYSLDEAGRVLCDHTTGPVLARWRQLNELLGADRGPTDDPRFEDERFPFPLLSDGEVRTAVQEYLGAEDTPGAPGGGRRSG
jgi:hypothetical protein